MSFLTTATDPVRVQIIVRDGCLYSERILNQLAQIKADFPKTTFEVVDAADRKKRPRQQVGITPSIWVDGKLWFLGTFCPEKLYSKLTEM